MKKLFFLLVVTIGLASCQPRINVLTNSVDHMNLNSLVTLEIGDNTLYLQDFILDVTQIDSVTSTSEYLQIAINADKVTAQLVVHEAMEQFVDLKIWIDGHAYSVPCRKSDKMNYVFSFNPQGVKYKNVQIAGQMNDWTPARMPPLTLNSDGLYQITMQLNPGTYLYQLVLDGDQNHDPTNPEKVDNGYGKFNSVLKISGKNDSFPKLFTHTYSSKRIALSYQNQVSEVFAYWQNYRLPAKFVTVSAHAIEVDLPVEATELDRSFLRVWASNASGVSNDVLIPLHKGKVLADSKDIMRTDKHAKIIYFMLIDRFKNGSKANDKPLNRPDVHPKVDFHGGDIVGLQQKIADGYFEKLGVNTLWISPLYQNPWNAYGYSKVADTKFSGYHGYWPISSSQVDVRFGTNNELKNMVSKAHSHNINILLDCVANHVHEQHPLYKAHPEYATNLYLPDGTLNVEKWDEHRLTTWFDTFLPTLDYSNPKVVEMMTDSALFWIREFGVDGFRHDACKHVQESFWRTLTLKMKRQNNGRLPFQVGETYGSPKLISSYLTTGMLDGQFDFNVYDIANTSFAGLKGGDFRRVNDVLQVGFFAYGNHNLMAYISGNHDKPRFMAKASGDVVPGEDTKAAGWKREIGISDSTAYDKLFLFHAFNLTIPGIPVIYYGDEIGMTGANDPDCRKMMRFDGWNNRESKLWENVATLTHLRRNNPQFIYGSFINLDVNTNTWAYARKYFENEALVFINNSAKSSTFEVKLPDVLQAKQFKSVFNNPFELKLRTMKITIPAFSAEVLIH